MVFTFKVPLMIESAIAFSDSFGDSKEPIKDARAWIYQLLTKKGVEWVVTQGNGGIGLKTVDKQGKQETNDVSLKDLKLAELIPKSDPDWLPELWEPEEVQPFETKIGKSLFEKLENTFALNRYASMELNKSILDWQKNKTDVRPEDKEEWQKNIKKMEEENKKFKKYPIEKFLHGILIAAILDKVKEHETKLLEKEYEELYADEDAKDKKDKKAILQRKKSHKSTKDPKD